MDSSITLTIGPSQGFYKPTIGPNFRLRYVLMGKGQTRKRTPVAHHLRRIIATNARARASKIFEDHNKEPPKNIPGAIWQASIKAGHPLSLSNVKRVLNGDRDEIDASQKLSVSVDQLNALALALDLLPYQLLMDGMDAINPQVAKGASDDEKQAYVVREAVKQAVPSIVKEYLEQTHPGTKRR